MRIAVSGTHGCGKSTVISDFLEACPEFEHEPEPFEWLDETPDVPGADSFFAQLRISVQRLQTYPAGVHVIAERCPLDFLAYLMALEELDRDNAAPELTRQAWAMFPEAMRHVDVLALLPIEERRPFPIPESEDLQLRQSVDAILLELADDGDLVGERVSVAEVIGTRSERLSVILSLT